VYDVDWIRMSQDSVNSGHCWMSQDSVNSGHCWMRQDSVNNGHCWMSQDSVNSGHCWIWYWHYAVHKGWSIPLPDDRLLVTAKCSFWFGSRLGWLADWVLLCFSTKCNSFLSKGDTVSFSSHLNWTQAAGT